MAAAAPERLCEGPHDSRLAGARPADHAHVGIAAVGPFGSPR